MVTDHDFCRHWLATVMVDVRKRFTKEQIASAWAWTSDRGANFEFHGPNDYFDHNLKTADCLWSAKAEGWSRLMDREEKDEKCLD